MSEQSKGSIYAKLFMLGADEWSKYRGTHKLSEIALEDTYFGSQNFSGFDLSKINFSKSNLLGVNLSHANLSGADFSDALLFCANLDGANMTGVKGDPNPNRARAKNSKLTFFTLWAYVVGLRSGYSKDEAFSLAGVAGLAYCNPEAPQEGDKPDNVQKIEFCGQDVEMVATEKGKRGFGRLREVDPESVRLSVSGNLGGKIGFDGVKEAMDKLADKYQSDLLDKPIEIYEKVKISENCVYTDQIEGPVS